MKLTRRWRDREKPTISFELFPPRTPKAAKRLDKVIAKLAALEPDFVSVTFGAGGSTREGSLRLADKLKNEQGLETLPEGDKAALNAFGVDFALRQCRELLAAGVAGLHIYTMDRSKSAVPLAPAPRAAGIL